MSATQAHALPGDGTVVAGQADIQTSGGGSNMLITQGSDRVIINWNSFSIGGSESVQFLQPGQNALAVNRVTGGDPSQIFGALTANGQIMLINPNGILFGQTSRVDVHSLVATTLDAPDDRLLSNDFRFDTVKNPSATVVNRGVITAADGGLVALVAPGVANDGLIQARLGKVTLAASHEFSVDLYGDGLVSLPVNSRAVDEIYDAEGNALSAPVSNSGTIRAPGGQVLLAARTAKNMVDDVVNMTGVIEARSVGVRNGVIVLDGGRGGGTGSGKVRVSGRMDVSGRATGEKGGTAKVIGDHIVIESDAVIDAAGDTGGGTVLVGGDYQGTGDMPRATTTTIATGSHIDASAITSGDGGKVIVWADDQTVFAGTILARGGYFEGHGGLIETSGRGRLSVLGTARADAAALNGQSGQWLLDPRDVYLRMGSGDDVSSGGIYDPSMDDAAVDINTILMALSGGTSVTITTHDIGGGQSGNIIFEDSINASASGGASFTLLADNNILLGGYSITSSGALNIVMDAGGYIQQAGGVLNSGGGAINLRAQDMMLGGTIDAGAGTVTLQGLGGGSIALGAGAGDLNLSSTELSAIKAGVLKIGDGAAGAITIGALIAPDAAVLHLQSGAGITGAGGGITVGQLALQAGGGISLTDSGTNVTTLAVSAAGQTVDFTNAVGFSIGSVSGVSGFTAADVTLQSGGAITQTNALLANSLSIAATGAVTLTNAANNINGLSVSAAGQSVSFTDVSGIDLAGIIADSLTLNAGGAVTDSADTAVATLSVTASGNVTLDNAGNHAGSVLVNAGANSIAYSDASAFSIAGLTGGNIMLSAGAALTQTGAINGNILNVTATGNVTLTNAANNVNGLNVSAAGQSVSYTDADGIDLAGIVANSLTLHAGGAVTDSADTIVSTLSVTAGGNVTLNNAGNHADSVLINAGANGIIYGDTGGFDIAGLTGGNITLSASGALTQTGAINGNILNLTATGGITLTNATNNISGLTVSAAGQGVSFTDVNGVDLAGVVADSLTLNAGGAVTDSGNTLATTLSVTAAGNVTLDSAGNNVGSVFMNAGAHNIVYRDTDAFDITDLTGGNITLTAGGALTQTGTISGNVLNITATGGVSLTNAANNVSGLIVSAAGQSVSFTDVGGLDLAGISANNFTLNTDGAVTDSGNTVVATLAVTADGNVTLNSAGNHASSVLISAGAHDIVYNDNSGFDVTDLTGGNITLGAGGALTQTGAISGNILTVTATGGITLNNAANNVNALAVSAAGQNVSYTDANGLDLAGVTAGNLNLSAGGAVTDSAATIVNALAVQAGGVITLDHAANNAAVIAMDAGGNNITYVEVNSVDIGAAGALTGLTASQVSLQLGGALTDSAASAIAGLLTIQAGTQAVTLDHAGNVFGSLSVLSASNLTVANLASLVLETTTLSGALNAQVNNGIIVAGNVSASGGVTLDTDLDNNGAGDLMVNGGVILSSGNAAMSITANDVALNGVLSSGSGQTSLLVSDGAAIDLGSGGSGGFNLSAAEIAAITAGTLKIGDASAGAITISSDITPGAAVLHLHTGSAITGTAGGVIAGALALQALGAVDLSGGTTNVTKLAIAAAGQNVTISEVNGFDIDAVAGVTGIAAGTLNITTGGALTDTAATTANSLVINAGGAVTLDVATNDVTTLQINAGANNITYIDANGFDIAGITGGNVFLRGAGAITDSGAITAAGLGIQNAAHVTLDHAASNVGVLAANTGAFNFTYTDVDGFDIATVGTVSGIQGNLITLTSGGAVTDSNAIVATTLDLTAAGSVTLDHAANNLTSLKVSAAGQNVAYNDLNAIDLLDVTAQRFTLSAGGAVTDTGRILVSDLGIQAAGVVTLNTANNNVDNLAINAGVNNVTFIDENGFAIGTVGAYSGLTGGVITLTAAGAVSGSAAINGTSLALTAAGNVTLNNVANSLTNLAISAAGFDVLYRDANALNIGDVGSVSGINAASFDLQVGGNLADTGAAALTISGHTNIVSTAGTIDLNAATNNFNTLSVSHVGNITSIIDANSLTITGLTRTGGTGTANISAVSGMTVSGNISTGALTLNADSNNDGAGTFTLDSGISINSLSNANVTVSSGNLVLDGTINSGSGITTVQSTGGNTIDLGNGGGGAYNISQAELNNITAGIIRVGGTASGAMTVSSNISAANSSTLRLQGAGITATAGAIIETNLALYSTGAVTMTNVANDVTTLGISAAGQTVSFYDANDLDIGLVDGATGAAAGTLRLETIGNLTDSQALTGTSLAAVSTGTITLDHASNNFVNVAFYAPGQAVRYHDLNAVAINTVSGVTGIEAGNLHLTTTNGNITDTARSLVSGATTLSSGTGSIVLDLTTNDFNTLAIASAGAVTIFDANSLTLNNITVSGATSLEANNGLVVDGNIAVASTLALNADRNNDNAGTLTINTGRTVSTAAVNQAVSLIGADLDIQGTGAVNSGTATTLLRTANTGRAIDIGGVGAAYNISQAEINAITAGILHIQSGTGTGALTLSTNITPTGTNTLYLQAGTGGINATGGSITVANLALHTTGAGNINATHAGNDVDNLAIQLGTGTADFRDVDSVNIGAVAGITGLNTTMSAGAGRTVHIQAAGITDSSPSTVQNFGFTSTEAVVLDHAGNNFAIIAGDAAGQAVTITDTSTLVIGQVTTLAPSTITGITANNVILNAGGALTDTHQSVISGNLTINAGANAVTLDHALNDFNTVIVSAAGNTHLVDANNLNIGASNIAGTLNVEAYGHITVTNNITSSGNATFRADLDNNGIGAFGVNASRTVNTSGANLLITAADIDLNGNLNSGSGNTTITVSGGLTIGLGDTAADMTIGKAELQRISAKDLYIGGSSAGNITVDNIALADLANISDSFYILALGNGSDIRFINNASFFKTIYGEADDSIFVDKNLTATVGQISLRADMDGAPDPDGDQIYVTDGISISSVGSSLFQSTNGITIGQNINIFGDLIINADTDNDGVGTLNLLGGYSIATNNYNLSLIAADFILSGLINAGTGRIQIETTNGRTIGLGDATGDMRISKAEFQRLTAGTLYIGGLNTSHIMADNLSVSDLVGISGNITLAALTSGAGISFNTNASSFGNGLTLLANNGVTLNQNVNVGGLVTIDADYDDNGVGDLNIAVARALTSNNNDISITANDVTLTGMIDSGTAQTILRASDNAAIDLGGSGGGFNLSAGELNNITSGILRIGAASGGAITVSSDIAPVNSHSMALYSGSTITATAGGIVINNLGLSAGGAITITDADTNIGTIAATTTTGNISVYDADLLSVGSVGGITGLSTAAGNMLLRMSDLDVLNAINSGSGTVTLEGRNGNTIGLGGAGGDMNLTAAELALISANTLHIGTAGSGAMTVSADATLAGINRLELQTGAGVTAIAGGLIVPNLDIVAGGDVIFTDSSTDVNALIVNAAGHNVTFFDATSLNAALTASSANISANNGLTITASLAANGAVTLNADADNNGSGTFTLNTGLNISTTNNALTITANDVVLQTGSTLSAGTNAASFFVTNGGQINLGGIGANMSLSNAELADITASTLIFGNASAGAITLHSLLTHNASTVYLHSGSTITGTSGGLITNALHVTAGGAVNLTHASNDVDNLYVSTVGQTVNFRDVDGINLAGITAGSFVLNAGGTVTDSAAITANSLSVTATGAVTLDHAGNDVNVLTISAGSNAVTYTDVNGFDIAGLSGGVVTLNASGTLSDSGTIAATTLSITTTGDVTLNTATNDVDNLTVSAAGRAVTFTDVDGINLAGITANSLTLNAGGAVTDSAATSVSALNVTSTGAVTLDHAGNDVNVLTISAGLNAVTYTDVNGFDIAGLSGGVVTLNASGTLSDSGTIAATTLSITTTGDVTLNTATNDVDNLTVSAAGRAVTFTDIDGINLAGVAAGSFVLNAGGTVTDSAASLVSGATVLTTGAGQDITLDHAGNDFGTLSVVTARHVTFVDSNSVTLGNISAATLNATAMDGLSVNGAIGASGAINMNANGNNDGNGLFQINGGSSVTAANADIAITASDVDIAGTIASGAGATSILSSNGRTISLGGAGGDMAISNTELNAITASTLRIGDVTAGNITVVADIAPVNVSTLHLRTGGNITATAGGVAVSNLALNAATGIDVMDASTLVSALAARSIAGNINFTNNGALSIATADGLTGIQATAGNLTLQAQDYNITQAINNAGGITTLRGASGGTISLGGAGGSMALNNTELNAITASTLRIGDATAGNITVAADIAPAGVSTLHLRTGGAVTATAGGIGVNNLALTAGTGIALTDTSTAVSNLAATTTAGDIQTVNNGTLNIAAVDGLNGIQATAGNVTLRSTDLNISQAINNAGGITTLLGSSGGTISLGGAGGALSLTAADLDLVTAALLRIGDNAAGNITVADDIAPANVSTMHLRTNGSITGTAGGIAVTHLALTTNGDINITDTNNNVSTLAISAPGRTVTFHDADAFVVGAVDSVSGATATTINFTAEGGITDNAAINADSLNIVAGGPVVLDTVTNDVNNLYVSAVGHQVTFFDADGINLSGITAGGFTLTANGAVTDSAASVVSGTTSIAAGAGNDITLDAANDFATLSVLSGRNIRLNDINAVALGASTISGTLDVTAGAGVTLSGAVTTAGATTIQADSDNDGIGTFTVNGGQSLNTGNASLSITAGDLALAGSINSGSALTTLSASNNGSIGLGTAADMKISAAEAANITAASLRLGHAGTSAIAIGGAMNFANVDTLQLRSAGTVDGVSGGILVNNLAINAGGAVTMGALSNNVNVLAISAPGQVVSYNDTNAFTVGTVDGIAGISGSSVALTAGGALSGTAAINATDLTITSSGTVNLGTVGNNVTNLAANAAGQNITFRDVSGLNLTGMNAQNATIITNGAVTDSGALIVAGTLDLTAGAASDITLDHTGNNFNVVRVVSVRDVRIVDNGNLSLGTSTISGALNIETQNNLTISGTVQAGGSVDLVATPANNGVFTINGGAALNALGQNVTVTAHDAALNGALNAGSGTVTMRSGAGAVWALGTAAGQFALSGAELAQITAATFTIGGAHSGNILVQNVSGVQSAGIGNMVLQAHGNQSIIQFGPGAVSFRSLVAQADAEIRVMGNLSVTEANMLLDGDYDDFYDMGYANNIVYGPGVSLFAQGHMNVGGTTGVGVMQGDLTMATNGGHMTLDNLGGAHNLTLSTNGLGNVAITGAIGGIVPVNNALINGNGLTGEIHAQALAIDANVAYLTGTVGGFTDEDAAFYVVLHKKLPGPYFMNGFIIEGYVPPVPVVESPVNTGGASDPTSMQAPWIAEVPHGLEQRSNTVGDLVHQDVLRHPYISNILEKADIFVTFSRDLFSTFFNGGVKDVGEITIASGSSATDEDDDQ